MDSLKILIVEDETITAMDLRETLHEAGHQVTAIARTYQQAVESVRTQPPDLALIDIHLGLSAPTGGITTAKELLILHRMPIIYLTANSDFQTFQLAKETLPAAYLLKPFRHDELKLQVELAYYYFQANLKNSSGSTFSGPLYLPVDNGHRKIDPGDVLFLEADGAYAKIHAVDREQPYHISTNLSHLAQYFPQPNFYRLSRSLLVNLDRLERMDRNHLFMDDRKTVIEIPAASRKELMKKLTVVRTK